MTRSSTLAFAATILALLACKGTGKSEDDSLPEAPALPTAEDEPTPTDAPSTPSAEASASASAAPGATSPGPGSTGPASGSAERTSADAGEDDESDARSEKDAGATAPPALDASVGDMQKRAQRCIKKCSAQFEKCKAVDISKLPECVQKQASCTAGCK